MIDYSFFSTYRTPITFSDIERRYKTINSVVGNAKFGLSIIGNASNNFNLLNYTYRNFKAALYNGAAFDGAWSNNSLNISNVSTGITKYSVFLTIYNRYGGLKKTYYLNSENDNPIKNIKVQLTQQGSGAGNIEFSSLDFPIEHEDIIYVYLNNELIYRGFIEQDIQITDRKGTIAPFNQRFKESLYSGVHSSALSSAILQSIVQGVQSVTGITWASSNVDITSTSLQTITYASDRAGTIIDKLIKQENGKYWGVDNDNVFYVKEIKQDLFDKYLYNTDNAIYEGVKIKNDYSKIQATEYQVYRPSSGVDLYIGMVGNSTNVLYPPLPLSYTMRRIQDKIKASEVLDNPTALKWAYAELKNQLRLVQTVDIKGIDVNQYVPKIGDYILIEDDWNYNFDPLIDCNSSANWINTSLSTGNGINYENSIKLFSSISSGLSYYDMGSIKSYMNVQKIGFYLNTAVTGRAVQVGLTNDLSTVTYTNLYCRNSSIFEYYDVSYTTSFRYIVFKNTNTDATNLFVDNISLLSYSKKQYIDNITEVNIEISDNGEVKCDAQCGEITDYVNKELFDLKKKIEVLEKNKEG